MNVEGRVREENKGKRGKSLVSLWSPLRCSLDEALLPPAGRFWDLLTSLSPENPLLSFRMRSMPSNGILLECC